MTATAAAGGARGRGRRKAARGPERPARDGRRLLLQARAYRGRLLTPVAADAGLRFIEDALIVVGEDGRIASVGAFAQGAFQGPVLDLRPAVLLPGFVDAHLHFPQARVTGSASGPLLEWLERTVFPEEARFTDAGYAAAVAGELVGRMLAVGTTTCAAFSTSSPAATHTLFEALERSGIRAVAGLTLMDQACPDALRLPAEEAIPAARDLVQRWHGAAGGLLRFAVTPRFAVSCSRPLLEAAAQLAADHGLLIQTHVSENPAEGEEALRAHPYADGYLDVYDRLGLLTPRTVLAHCVHLSPREWDRVAEAGARVAHCPDSNFFLGSGRMALREPLARGVTVALGSDVGAGRSFDLRRAMSSAFDAALCTGLRAPPAALLRAATLGGAEALGLAAEIGTLEPGKDADFIAVDVPEHARTEAELLAQIAFASDAAAVRRAYVRGAQVHAARLDTGARLG